jgi:hypothetical protein
VVVRKGEWVGAREGERNGSGRRKEKYRRPLLEVGRRKEELGSEGWREAPSIFLLLEWDDTCSTRLLIYYEALRI